MDLENWAYLFVGEPRNIPDGRIEDANIFKNFLNVFLFNKSFKVERKEPIQRVVSENELENYLNEGWQFVSSLSNDSKRCVVEQK